MLTKPEHIEFGGERQSAPRAIVVGSGFGGLAAAVRLGVRGYKVTVLERLDRPGGRARVFKQDGFVFDAGPTIKIGTGPALAEIYWPKIDRFWQAD
ncbi:MAG: NAD(P)-binding protein, partial [Pseudomonadota bacterium]